MELKLEREQSLKKLHFCIANYHPSQQDQAALVSAQQDLRDKIQFKFKRSVVNQGYVFPRKTVIEEEYCEHVEVVDLNRQVENQVEGEGKLRLKIKLAKGRTDKRMQTEPFQKIQTDEKPKKICLERPLQDVTNRQQCQITSNFVTAPTQPIKGRMKTQYAHEEEEKVGRSIKKLQNQHFLNTLQRESGSRSKSKLNMLTKSYMNLKSNKLPLKNSLQKSGSNSIRTNDYKFMPNTTTHTKPITQQNGSNSTRELRQLLHSNQINLCKPNKQGILDSCDARHMQKIVALLPDRKYFKAKY